MRKIYRKIKEDLEDKLFDNTRKMLEFNIHTEAIGMNDHGKFIKKK